MTKSPSEIAELLAKKLTIDLTERWSIGTSSQFLDDSPDWDSDGDDAIIEQILQSIPLKELLECKRRLELIKPPEFCPWCSGNDVCYDCLRMASLNGSFARVLNDTDTKLREAIGGGE